MKTLISAYACRPGWGSEPGVGWNLIQQLSVFAEVWVLTRPDNQPFIDGAAVTTQGLPIRWIYCDLPAGTGVRKILGVNVHYALWQCVIFFKAQRLHCLEKFDLCHHLTYTRFWVPSFLPWLGIPCVLGPLGGIEDVPGSFLVEFSWYGRLKEKIRKFGKACAERNIFLRQSFAKAKKVLAVTPACESRLRELGCRDTAVLYEAGMAQQDVRAPVQELKVGPKFRVLAVGRLEEWKGTGLALAAFADFVRQFPESELWVVGAGPGQKRLVDQAQRLGVQSQVKFLGSCAREKVLQYFRQADAVLHLSLREPGGWVCLEAMASGKPVICLDIGGPAYLVGDTGIRIIPTNPEKVVWECCAALKQLAADPQRRQELGQRAVTRVRDHFLWEQKGRFLKTIYAQLLDSK